MNSNKKRKSTLLVCLGMVMTLAFATLAPMTSMEAQAAKTVTSNYTYTKAPAVKTGTTTVIAKPYKGSNNSTKTKTAVSWVKFTAPKAGTYQFTISNYGVKGDSSAILHGAVTMMTGKSTYSGAKYPKSYLKVKTQGGKVYTLWLCSASAYRNYGKITTGTSLTSRTATVKLKKGQVVYLDFNNSKTVSCKLNIKRK